MDNVTHTLTGAIASKAGPERHHSRVVFWVLVVSVNIPDIEIVMQLFFDRVTYLQHYRGFTHSLLFAPFFAGFIAYILKLSVRNLDFTLVFAYTLLGILLHIFFDLINSFGTMIFYPVSNTRYTLDLVFIIDPWLTGSMIIALILGRIYRRHRRKIMWGAIAFIVLYFVLAYVNREVVRSKAEAFFASRGIDVEQMIVIPQPLAMTNWMVAVQTEDAAFQIFTNTFQNPDEYVIIDYPRLEPNEFIVHAESTEEVEFYRWFARLPVYDYYQDGELHIVEYYDLQFVLNPHLVDRLNIPNRAPFVLRLVFDEDGTLLSTEF